MPAPSTHNRRTAFTRRRFVLSSMAWLGFPVVTAAAEIRMEGPFKPLQDIFGAISPDTGIDIGVTFGDSIQKLIATGALDPEKLRATSDSLPDWVERLLRASSSEPIVFSSDTAPYLVNLLWPLGLSTRAAFNETSPISTLRIPYFASTGGWTLGRAQRGYVYFNRVDAIKMNERQEALVLEVATNTYRPCCNNSTFFQDCNHGSALLGLMELAASQGAALDRLYRIAVVANSYWFAEQYAKTAEYFSRFRTQAWNDVAPQLILGRDFSSLSGWEKNVNAPLLLANVELRTTGLRPRVACGI